MMILITINLVAVMKIKNIFIGWAKRFGLLPTSEAETKLSVLRLKQCSSCVDADEKKVLQILNGNAHYENMLACTRCGCPCKEKSLVLNESCPIGKW